MIRLPDTPLSATALSQLQKWQQAIDSMPDYAMQVEEAKRTWGNRNTAGNKTFATVRTTLAGMCCGVRRCCYCEDSYANQVEHIRPKDFYPDFAYVWENYVYACGPCNAPKNNHFAVFVADAVNSLQRLPGTPVVPPINGPHVLINPRFEDPLDFLFLDIAIDIYSSFSLQPSADEGTLDYLRADYTIKLLGLNERSLPESRQAAYHRYKAMLHLFIAEKSKGTSINQLQRYTVAIQREAHPTVWREMQRQHTFIPELASLFAQVPEALGW